MKKALTVLAGALLLTGALSAQAATVVLDFEDLPGSGVMPDGYHGLINWEAGVWNYYDSPQSPYTPHSGVVRTYQSASDTTPSWTFLTPVVFDGAWWSGQSSASAQYNLYDASNTLVATSGVVFGSSTPTWLASGYSGLVSHVEVLTPQADYIVMDDLTYETTAPVPEPGTYALLAAGIAGLVLRKRMARS